MGMSPEGVLFWGVVYEADELGDLFPENESGECGCDRLDSLADALYDRARDLDCPEPAPTPGYSGPEWDAWRVRVRLWELRGCSVGRMGHSDSSGKRYVCVRASRLRAEWDESVTVGDLAVPDLWRLSLADYLRQLGLPLRATGWYLTSYYG